MSEEILNYALIWFVSFLIIHFLFVAPLMKGGGVWRDDDERR